MPKPQKVEKFLDYDDFRIMQEAKAQGEDRNCRALLDRNHIRAIFTAPETPTEENDRQLEDIKQKLANNNIWFHEDKATSGLWYKLNTEEESKEIMVVRSDKGDVAPLSDFSQIVRNMGEVKQARIYVNPADKEKAVGVLQ